MKSKVVGFTLSTYDALLMFSEEFDQVFSNRRNNPFFRNILLFNRYGMLLTFILYISTVSIPVGNMTREWVHWLWLGHNHHACIIDRLVIYVLCWMWNWRKDISWMLIMGFATITCINVTFIAIAISQFYNITFFLELGVIRTCYVSKIPQYYIRTFICSPQSNDKLLKAAMDCYALFFLTMNALSRPRLTSQGILKVLLRDGLQFLLVTLTMKLTNVITTATTPVAIALFVPTLGLAVNSTATSRFYVQMCIAKQTDDLRQHEVPEIHAIDKEIPLELLPTKSLK
ncbi:hypothetical protein SCHPADRAFT_941547 [Schizopora paradoxa]|uniref:DUF6533 domain-containing protein n=1 Tax=Schizopora paradoxa TaxID=27342 RepID=A0A0H2RRF3_9AGAM|nr:hypothetical protein SCHPADRAFT_941547 [Schizopora paradoxa]